MYPCSKPDFQLRGRTVSAVQYFQTVDCVGDVLLLLFFTKKLPIVLALKANHPNLYTQVKQWFDLAQKNNFEGVEVSYDRRVEKGHHRLEKRCCWAVSLSAFGGLYQQEQWLGLKTIVMVERVRHLWNKTTREVQFYLSSLPADAQVNGSAIRQHWGIENRVNGL